MVSIAQPAAIPAFRLENLGRACRDLLLEANGDLARIEQLNKAYLYLAKCEWHVEGNTLVVESARRPGEPPYRVTNTSCECESWNRRGRCWHADALRIVVKAMQLVARPAPRTQRPMAELQAEADEIFA